jgi:hypothetical protein
MFDRELTLVAKVKATNKANAYAMEIYDKLAAVFAPLVGQKIEKADGGLMAKYAKLLPEFISGVPMHVYRYNSNYSLMYVVKTCESIPPHGCTYYEASCYVGEMRDGVLTKLCNRPQLRTDYTVAEVKANREAYKAAQAIADDAKGKLHPFGEYDN